MLETVVIICVFYTGFGVAAWVYRKPPPPSVIKVDDQFIHNLNLAAVEFWLEQNNMTWQPKGAVFNKTKATNGKH